MAVNPGLAHLSDTLFTTAIATYTLAMGAYTAEYAFGRRGHIAATTTMAMARERILVGAGAPLPTEEWPPLPTPAAALPRTTHRTSAERVGRIAVAITILGVLLHAASIAIRGSAVDEVPWSNMYQFSAVVGLIAVFAFLALLARMPQIRYLGGLILLPVILLMFLAGTVLYANAEQAVPALQSYWLAIHVTAAASSEGILLTSSVLTMLYLLRRRYDIRTAAGQPSRYPTALAARLPAPDTLDKVAYRAAVFAFPIYTFGVIAGAIWAEAAWGRYWGWDPKETWAFIAWVIYAAYLHARATAGWKHRAAAWINLTGFAAMTFNFFIVNIVISGLHSYAGLN